MWSMTLLGNTVVDKMDGPSCKTSHTFDLHFLTAFATYSNCTSDIGFLFASRRGSLGAINFGLVSVMILFEAGSMRRYDTLVFNKTPEADVFPLTPFRKAQLSQHQDRWVFANTFGSWKTLNMAACRHPVVQITHNTAGSIFCAIISLFSLVPFMAFLAWRWISLRFFSSTYKLRRWVWTCEAVLSWAGNSNLKRQRLNIGITEISFDVEMKLAVLSSSFQAACQSRGTVWRIFLLT